MNNALETFFIFLLSLKDKLKRDLPYLGGKFSNIIDEIKQIIMESNTEDVVFSNFRSALKKYVYVNYLSSNGQFVNHIARYYNPFIDNRKIDPFVENGKLSEVSKYMEKQLLLEYNEQMAIINQQFIHLTEVENGITLTKDHLKECLKEPPVYFNNINEVLTDETHDNFYTNNGKTYIKLTLEPCRLKAVVDLGNYDLFIVNVHQRHIKSSWVSYFDSPSKRKIMLVCVKNAIDEVYRYNKSTELTETGVRPVPLAKSTLSEFMGEEANTPTLFFIEKVKSLVSHDEPTMLFDPVTESVTFYIFFGIDSEPCDITDNPNRVIKFKYCYKHSLKRENVILTQAFRNKSLVFREGRLYPGSTIFKHFDNITTETIIAKSHKGID